MKGRGESRITNFVKHGDDFALVIDQDLLDYVGITAETDLKITTDGESLFIKPLEDQNVSEKP